MSALARWSLDLTPEHPTPKPQLFTMSHPASMLGPHSHTPLHTAGRHSQHLVHCLLHQFFNSC